MVESDRRDGTLFNREDQLPNPVRSNFGFGLPECGCWCPRSICWARIDMSVRLKHRAGRKRHEDASSELKPDLPHAANPASAIERQNHPEFGGATRLPSGESV